jgi:thiol-disulfide isomerase/thioredoxin
MTTATTVLTVTTAHQLTARLLRVAIVQLVYVTVMHAQGLQDSTIIVGSLAGADTRVPVRADVELIALRDPNRTARVQVRSDGSFRLGIVGVGPFRLRAAGVGYVGLERSLPVTTPGQLSVQVTLAGLPAGLGKGPLVGVSNETDAAKPRPDIPPAVLLTAVADGKRVGQLRAKRDTVAYRVVDITARRYLPPAGAVGFRWADDGEYEGLAIATAGRDVSLTYDSAMVSYGGAPSFRVLGEHPIASIVAQLEGMLAYQPRKRCILDVQGTPINPADAVLPDETLASQLALIRRLLVADAECQTHRALGAAVVEQFTPGSPLWQLDDVMRRRVLFVAARHAAGQARFDTPAAIALVRDRFDASLRAAADTAARFDLYVAAAETFMPTDTVDAQSYTARFVSESYAHPRVIPLLRLTGYNRVLQPGRAVPAFRVPSMNNRAVTISDASLKGSVYLLDVWATWCPDCIVELPALRDLNTKYGKRGLRIVSVSVDEEQGTADRYRRIGDPMPWTHGFAGAAPDGGGPLAGFEVAWLPTTILVGKDGRILALAPKLESAEFAALIEQALR